MARGFFRRLKAKRHAVKMPPRRTGLTLQDAVSFENAEEVLAEALRLIMKEGSDDLGNNLVTVWNKQADYFAQFFSYRGSSEVHGIVPSNDALYDHQLDVQQINRLLELGWTEIDASLSSYPDIQQDIEDGKRIEFARIVKLAYPSFYQLWQDVDNEKRSEIARITLRSFEVYGACAGADLEFITEIDGLATWLVDAYRLERKYNEKKRQRQRRETLEWQQKQLQQETIGNGYIYVLLNASYAKNILKIGKTERLPEIRAQELSSATGVPTKFVVAYEASVADCDLAERLIHEQLESYRISASREFFEIPLKEAISVVDPIVRDINKR